MDKILKEIKYRRLDLVLGLIICLVICIISIFLVQIWTIRLEKGLAYTIFFSLSIFLCVMIIDMSREREISISSRKIVLSINGKVFCEIHWKDVSTVEVYGGAWTLSSWAQNAWTPSGELDKRKICIIRSRTPYSYSFSGFSLDVVFGNNIYIREVDIGTDDFVEILTIVLDYSQRFDFEPDPLVVELYNRKMQSRYLEICRNPPKKIPPPLFEYLSYERCPTCRYEFTASMIFEKGDKTASISCPRCRTIIEKKITKNILAHSKEL